MKINKINEIAFSPCFSTDKTARLIADEIADKLNLKAEYDKFTVPKDRVNERNYDNDELLVIASPTYAGKLPNKILPDFQTKFKGNNTPAIAIVSYGNRSFDNSLAELVDTLAANGFKVIGAVAIASEHVMGHMAAGKPDFEDKIQIKEFAAKCADKLLAADANNIEELCKFTVPGDSKAPYYTPLQENLEKANFLKAKPLTDMSKCTNCGACARMCPTGAINPENIQEVPGICIKCHACVNRCTKQAKYFDDPQLASHIRYLQTNHSDIKKSDFYL